MRLMIFLLSIMLSATSDLSLASSFDDREDVKQFIHEMVTQYHLKETDLKSVFSQVALRPTILKKNATTIERTPWFIYSLMFVNDKRIKEGLLFWHQYVTALAKAEKEFGVPAHIIVATIGIETKYGKETGKYRVIDALVNLAFGDSPRKSYFRKELVQFLLLCKDHNINPLTVMGSYSGAIGQPQFMPSSYRHYAVNFSGNDKIDLSHNEIDVIGSIANFYKKNGWVSNQPIAMPLSLRGGKFQFKFRNDRSISYSELIDAGMITAYRGFPKEYKILTLQKQYGEEIWLLFPNFNVIRRYNHSDLYAMSVFQLSYYLKMLRGNQYVSYR